jgi:hypothetical protein
MYLESDCSRNDTVDFVFQSHSVTRRCTTLEASTIEKHAQGTVKIKRQLLLET